MDSKLRGFKVSNADRSRVCGIGCRSLTELVSKAKRKFKIKDSEAVHLHLLDGTIVDDEEYFQTLPSQTFLYLARNKEKVLSGADIIYNALSSVSLGILKSGQSVMEVLNELISSGKISPKRTKESKAPTKCTRKEHPEWFDGLETNSTTKEEFMFRRCQDRIRCYLYSTIKDIKSSKNYRDRPGFRQILDQSINTMKDFCSQNKFNGFYFDRGHCERMCDHSGTFICHGIWSLSSCSYGSTHKINPYSSREERIVFSTWNFDHRIERTRTVIPALLDALDKAQQTTKLIVNVNYFCELLFTKTNLKLVHIVCHDKTSHTSALVDQQKVFLTEDHVRHVF